MRVTPTIRFGLVLAAILAAGCRVDRDEPPASSDLDDPGHAEVLAPDQYVKLLADAFLDGWFDRNPEQGTYYGVPGWPHNRLTDNSPDALKAWEAREDAWLAQCV